MESKIVGLIAAMPGEIKPLLRIAGKHSKTRLGAFNLYSLNVAGRQCRLIESGIGMKRAARAAQTLITGFSPEKLISFGFGGAVLPGMAAGDLAIAGRVFPVRESLPDAGETIGLLYPSGLLPNLQNIGNTLGFAVGQCDILTSDKILNKKELVGGLPSGVTNPVLDMETWAIALEAVRRNVPLLAIRAISDAAEEELEFCLERFMDREMNIRISRVLLTIASRPGILPQLIRLAGNSRSAGRNLAVALEEVVRWEPSLPGHQTPAGIA